MLLAKTYTYQRTLANYCRTGNLVKIEGAKAKNLPHYRRLVFSNVIDSLSTAYPLTEKLLQEEKWKALVDRFFSSSAIQSPQIWYMPKEFKDYVLQEELTLLREYPFLSDLLEFEWAEVEVFMMPDEVTEKAKENYYSLNPELEILRLEFPVHVKNVQAITVEDKGTYFVSLHRHPESGAVQFTNLSVPYVDVLEHLSVTPLSEHQIKEILKKYAPADLVDEAFGQFITKALATQLIFKGGLT